MLPCGFRTVDLVGDGWLGDSKDRGKVNDSGIISIELGVDMAKRWGMRFS